MKLSDKNLNQLGFTLIELLVVVAIIGILTAVLLVNLVGVRERGADTKKKSELNQLRNSMRLYYNDNQSYPGNGGNSILACGDGNDACSQGDSMNDGSGTVYMRSVPEYSEYWVSADGEQFYVGVALVNTSDQEAAESGTKCGVPAGSITPGTFYICAD